MIYNQQIALIIEMCHRLFPLYDFITGNRVAELFNDNKSKHSSSLKKVLMDNWIS